MNCYLTPVFVLTRERHIFDISPGYIVWRRKFDTPGEYPQAERKAGMSRKAYGICLFLLAAVLVFATAACKTKNPEKQDSNGAEKTDQEITEEDTDDKQSDLPEGTEPEADDLSGKSEDKPENGQPEQGEQTEKDETESGNRDQDIDSGKEEEKAPTSAEVKNDPERIGIYTIDDETLETVSLTALINTAGGLTPEAVVEAVALALEDHLIEIQIGSITVEGKKVTVDIKSEDANLPFGNTGSSVEGVILDCITYSLFDNFKELREIYFTVNGGAYESGHISLGIGEAYQTK